MSYVVSVLPTFETIEPLPDTTGEESPARGRCSATASPSSASLHISTMGALERRALVDRTGGQTDRRRVAVAITDAGRELLMSREHVVVDAMVRALATEFTSAERNQLESAIPLLDRLAHRL